MLYSLSKLQSVWNLIKYQKYAKNGKFNPYAKKHSPMSMGHNRYRYNDWHQKPKILTAIINYTP